MKLLLITFMCVIATCSGDIIRTVYCRNQCTDYISIPEISMPLCAPEHLKMKECGSVITCDWAEAERDNARPIANISSDVICCYRATIKEKGDCAESMTAELPRKDTSPELVAFTEICSIHIVPWLLCTVLLVVVILQAIYIVKLSIARPSHQKVTQSEDPPLLPQVVVAHPIVNTRPLSPAIPLQ